MRLSKSSSGTSPAAALARKTFAENGWADRAAFHEGDLRDVSVLPKAGSVDYVISNPPYFPADSGESAKGEARQIAREETSCTLDDVCAAAQTSSSVQEVSSRAIWRASPLALSPLSAGKYGGFEIT